MGLRFRWLVPEPNRGYLSLYRMAAPSLRVCRLKVEMEVRLAATMNRSCNEYRTGHSSGLFWEGREMKLPPDSCRSCFASAAPGVRPCPGGLNSARYHHSRNVRIRAEPLPAID